MKIVKTVKGKVLIGATAMALFAGTGVAFGASDAGTRLENWFKIQVGLSKESTITSVNGYIDGKKPELLAEYNEKKVKGGEKITNLGKTSTTDVNNKIDKSVKEHTDAIEKKKAELNKYASSEFSKLLDSEKKRLRDLSNQVAAAAQTDTDNFTGEKGSKALADLEREIGAKTDQATADLETAIANAKLELETNLGTVEETTLAELKKIVDGHIADLRIWTTNMINFSVQEQTDLIESKAKALEKAAMDEIKSIVEGI